MHSGLGVPSLRLLWGALQNRQLYILHMDCKSCISLSFSIFFIIYTTYRKKKLHAFTAKKTFHDLTFFLHVLHFSHWNVCCWGMSFYLCQCTEGHGLSNMV